MADTISEQLARLQQSGMMRRLQPLSGRGAGLVDHRGRRLINLSSNDYGVYVDNSFNNRIYLNNLINNGINAHSWNSSNFWNSTDLFGYIYKGAIYKMRVGNYWSGYFGPDHIGDGLGDRPQIVSEKERDQYPLKDTSEKYALRG